jgi:hypothetical protein
MQRDIILNTILLDIRHALKNIWLSIAVLAVVVSFWLDLGTDAFWLLRGGEKDPMELLRKALSGSGSAISLPLLASLPCAASAWQELQAGAARLAVFRCGRFAYVSGKLIAVLFMAALAQAIGLMIFLGMLLMISPAADTLFPGSALLARLLAAMFFSAVGGAGALIAGDAVSAYAIPIALCFALSMISSRFLISVRLANPLNWLKGDPQAIGLLILLIISASALYVASLRLVMKQYV